jgi:hypothetical protein
MSSVGFQDSVVFFCFSFLLITKLKYIVWETCNKGILHMFFFFNLSYFKLKYVTVKHISNFIIWLCIEYTSPWTGFELTTLMVIGTDCTGSCKSNYHTIMTKEWATRPHKISSNNKLSNTTQKTKHWATRTPNNIP